MPASASIQILSDGSDEVGGLKEELTEYVDNKISQLSSEKVDKTSLTLGLHTDGLFYIFVDGTPIGNGIALPSKSGDVVGNIDSANNIVLMGDIPEGNYSVKYKTSDGTLIDIGGLDYFEDPEQPETPTYTNILTSGKYPVQLNKRWSASGKSYSSCNGMIAIEIPYADIWNKTIYFKGFTNGLKANNNAPIWYLLKSDGTKITHLKEKSGASVSGDIWEAASLQILANEEYAVAINSTTFTTQTDADHFVFNMAVNASTAVTTLPDTLIMTIDEPIEGGGSDVTTPINQIPISINADGTPFVGTNGEKGYKTNTRLSISSGGESTSSASGLETTGFIPIKAGDTIYIKGITIDADSTTQPICWYNANFEPSKTGGANSGGAYAGQVFGGVNGEVASVVFNATNLNNHNVNEDVAYIRLTAKEINENSILTINQPITGGE